MFSIQQVPVSCVGDCDGNGQVTVDEVLVLVNLALGNSQVVGCASGVPASSVVDVGLIVQAVNRVLGGCSG